MSNPFLESLFSQPGPQCISFWKPVIQNNQGALKAARLALFSQPPAGTLAVSPLPTCTFGWRQEAVYKDTANSWQGDIVPS